MTTELRECPDCGTTDHVSNMWPDCHWCAEKDVRMTPETLTMIRKAERQSVSAFVRRLGISRNTLGGYEKGKQPIPHYIALACTAIYRRLEAIE